MYISIEMIFMERNKQFKFNGNMHNYNVLAI